MSDTEGPGLPVNTPTIAPVYVDGSPLDEIQFYKIQASKYISNERSKYEGNFWSSLPRRQADQTTEVFEVGLVSQQLVNTLSFSLPRFPHIVRAQYLDPADDEWKALRHDFGTPVQYAINDSLPLNLSPTALAQGAAHPQHYGAGHWLHQEAVLRPVRTRRVRLLLTRAVGQPPRDYQNNPVPYSLGVKEFSLGYKVKAKSSIPRTGRHPTVRTEFNPFSSGIDSLGSPLAYALRENRAEDILNGLTWRCEPQPVPDAVVSLYVDTRDAEGNAPVVDRFFVDPTHNGVQMNLYWSNDESIGSTAKASDSILSFPASYALGDVVPKDSGLLFNEPDASVTIDNIAVQWRPDQSWWMGYQFSPEFTDADTTARILFDSGALTITLTEGVLTATMGSMSVSQDLTFGIGAQTYFVVAFDGGAFSLVTEQGMATAGESESLMAVVPEVSNDLRFGMNVDDLVGSSFTRLRSFVLKQETPDDPAALYQSFSDDPDDYVVKADFDDEDTGSTDNAILRYHPSFQTEGADSLNPLGFLGGPGDRYDDKEWTPVSRDFRLQRGMLHFPPVQAKFFKFEFTELVAEPYDTYSPVVKRVKKHPQWIKVRHTSHNKGGNRADDAKGGLRAAVVAAIDTHFRDDQRQVGSIPRVTPSSLATASMVSSDADVAKRMRQISSYFNLVKWLPGTLSNKFPKGKHVYATMDIDHVHRVAYFVGLQDLQMYRLDYAVDDDSEQYIELFHDDANLDTNQWGLGENYAEASTSSAVMQSRVFNSRRKVRGVQFATVQSNALQLIDDADFLDLSLAGWAPYGDVAPLEFSQDLATDLGTTIRVTRQMGLVGRDWDDLEAVYPTWADIEGVPWDDLQSSGESINYGGITGTQQVSTTTRGRVYAAARVFVDEPLDEPLYLQIVTPDNDVLSESPIDPQPGQVTEWYTGYTIGEGGDAGALTWDEAEVEYPTWDDAEETGSWSQVTRITESLQTTVVPRIVQYGLTDDVWDVDNISIFNDPIVWEFSNDGGDEFYPVYDIRNNADGCFIFPDYDTVEATPGLGTRLVWRVVSYHPGAWVSSLLVRPWYTGLSLGIPHREAIQYGGPNQTLWDDYPEVHEDPHFMLWDLPIPQDWWFRFRREILPTLVPSAPTVTVGPPAVLNDSFIV
jgi:hypothetical protein